MGWQANGMYCNADRETTLKFYPNHFKPLEGLYLSQEEQMKRVDEERPWE